MRSIADAFRLTEFPELEPRYNIAPTQKVVTIVAGPERGSRQARLLRWGLVPHWADDPSIGNRMLNARGETVDAKPAFRKAFADHRCIVVADGFYENTRQVEHRSERRKLSASKLENAWRDVLRDRSTTESDIP